MASVVLLVPPLAHCEIAIVSAKPILLNMDAGYLDARRLMKALRHLVSTLHKIMSVTLPSLGVDLIIWGSIKIQSVTQPSGS